MKETRICEQSWHPPVQLDKFQECPHCKSTALHQVDFTPTEEFVEDKIIE